MKKNSTKFDPQRCEWIKNHFKGDDVFIVGGGFSLYNFDFERLNGKRVIAINHAYRYCQCEVLVFLDSRFRKEVEESFGHDIYTFPFKIIAGPSSGMKNKDNCTIIQLSHKPTNNPASLFGRAQSGLIAINTALVGGARFIYLMGFDGGTAGKHFYSYEWPHSQDGKPKQYQKMIRHYEQYGRYENIINLNPDSEFPMFKKKKIEEAL